MRRMGSLPLVEAVNLMAFVPRTSLSVCAGLSYGVTDCADPIFPTTEQSAPWDPPPEPVEGVLFRLRELMLWLKESLMGRVPGLSPTVHLASPFYLCGQPGSDCCSECAACLPIWP